VLALEDVRKIAKPAFMDSPFAHHASLDPWWIEGLRWDLPLSQSDRFGLLGWNRYGTEGAQPVANVRPA
jgi:hypothetical protein